MLRVLTSERAHCCKGEHAQACTSISLSKRKNGNLFVSKCFHEATLVTRAPRIGQLARFVRTWRTTLVLMYFTVCGPILFEVVHTQASRLPCSYSAYTAFAIVQDVVSDEETVTHLSSASQNVLRIL